MNIKPCKFCSSTYHFPYMCREYPKKRKPLKTRGKRTLIYEEWRDNIAIPHLDKTYGHRCSYDGCNETKNLDVDHILKRGSHPKLKMELTNVRWMCRPHHMEIT